MPITTLPTNEQISQWRAAQTDGFQLYLQILHANGHDEGFQQGVEKANQALRLNRILIPLCILAFPLGVLGQRYLQLIN